MLWLLYAPLTLTNLKSKFSFHDAAADNAATDGFGLDHILSIYS